MADHSDDPVQLQYEQFPYPHRDPADEATRLVTGSPSHLAEIRHYLYAGQLDVTRGFRALIAGGGTGDAAIMLAQQLADAGGGEVVYLDMSTAARAIAEARAQARGLTNITFVTGSLTDVAALDLGRFDYIDCCGVLHHLEDPPAGMRALAQALRADVATVGGGMGVMVYAPYGRTGVYPMQQMLAQLAGDRPLTDQIATVRRLWDQLPASNWLRRNPFVGDHKRSDAELVDLLLHARDRSYTVPEFAELLSTGGLRPAAFLEPARYDPATYLNDPKLLQPLGTAGLVDRAAFAERLTGAMKKHIAYVVPADASDPVAQLDDGAVPMMPGSDPAALVGQLGGASPKLTITLDGQKRSFPLPRLTAPILRQADGTRAVGEIVDRLCNADRGLNPETARRQIGELYAVLNGLNLMLLSRSI
ncbi:class I SAM-dependent methyltransferase [Rhodovibrio salinarum]|uniref:Class I SAM-dependent methyltransferase n=1 Tax=Rhodovibrio salinarum TaxID=1087 RepID=A0A934QH13_9PROT|nr:class I SAM-dependent methyltransferase [Rhodovibrio salinarum]MBK1696856.1 class I SAM-dependent methyltransferase [Rhodovibrio salinarum]